MPTRGGVWDGTIACVEGSSHWCVYPGSAWTSTAATSLGLPISGLIGSIYHIVLKETSPALKAVQVAATSTVTMVGAVFGLTTCFSAQIREKPEDPLNYFIGGCTSGMVFGVRTHSFTTGAGACAGLGILAAVIKMSKNEGWKFAPPPGL
ncbi:NADH dehydrogenase [ubiquinone] 1 alpha subcomplex subunit 11 isoform A [Alligator mississippiensis]|uniref:NADH dehydrogenase [ubiquinone] 1 alpha subcomplex subunit 11 n=1 Tax=Alligator mississippiensis TaxID=8496 RepID=A0A151NCD7_ALLMI|nr:NADH dehydrogenase [ubiquinone] 1 alpha subcomplex subunit 11 isoform A [Alligator mississippiensis]